MAGFTSPARFGVVFDLLNRGKPIFLYSTENLFISNTKTLTDDLAFFLFPHINLAVIRNRRLKRLPPHNRTVHLFLRHSIKIIGNVLIGYFEGFFNTKLVVGVHNPFNSALINSPMPAQRGLAR